MAIVRYNIRIDEFENEIMVELEAELEDDIRRYVRSIKDDIRGLILSRAEVNSPGGLADSLKVDVFNDDFTEGKWNALIYSELDHAIWFEEGTGLFGPRKSWIFPRHYKHMMFKPRGKTSRVFAAKVEGQKGKHPFRDGVRKGVGRGGSLRRIFE